ncbi:MAG: AmmeMemoRadiSam system radical SAM enzyme [Methanomassiliicoccales archaeon]|nr:AmmeMemoRadiSam system radical SAM enzyme [Methanomassiliicoccales archaeon]
MHEARFWEKEGERIRCHLCPHNCSISPMRRGICGVRENRDGKLYSMNYGKVAAANFDPIEKKPLFHFYPGEDVFSIGSIGCNFRCRHCQNFNISQAQLGELVLREMSPEAVSETALSAGSRGVAFTYNEPTIWHEFAYDAMKIAKEKGMFTVYVTNGFIQEEPLRELSPFLDAMNIDVKGFTERFYDKVCKAPLEPVLRTVELAHRLGIHVELTYLIIPGENDDRDEIRRFSEWVVSLDKRIPVHFSRFHPDYEMSDKPPTPIRTMEAAKDIGKEAGLQFIYLGNVMIPHGEDTVCPNCGTLLIERMGFSIGKMDARDGRCPVCGQDLYMVQRKSGTGT